MHQVEQSKEKKEGIIRNGTKILESFSIFINKRNYIILYAKDRFTDELKNDKVALKMHEDFVNSAHNLGRDIAAARPHFNKTTNTFFDKFSDFTRCVSDLDDKKDVGEWVLTSEFKKWQSEFRVLLEEELSHGYTSTHHLTQCSFPVGSNCICGS
jgi:hypothetical protein